MILFLISKWIMPKHNTILKQAFNLFVILTFLCSTLSILAILIIQFIQTNIFISFMQKDFHLSFLNTQKNLTIWEQVKKENISEVSQNFQFTIQSGLLASQQFKFPIQLELIEAKYLKYFHMHLVKGTFNPSTPSILLSQEIADKVQAHIGDVVDFYFIKRNPYATDEGKISLLVTGILDLNISSDPYLVFAPISVLGDIFITQLQTGIILKKEENIKEWRKKLYKEGITAKDVLSRHSNFLFSLEWEKVLLYFVLYIIIFISAIIIYFSITIFIEKLYKQWGILRTLGVSFSKIFTSLFFILITVFTYTFFFSIFISIGLISLYLFYIKSLYLLKIIIPTHSILYIFFGELLIVGLSFLVPVYRIHKKNLLEWLKNEN